MLRQPFTCSLSPLGICLPNGSVVIRAGASNDVAEWSAAGGVGVGGSGTHGSGHGGADGLAGGGGVDVVVAVVCL